MRFRMVGVRWEQRGFRGNLTIPYPSFRARIEPKRCAGDGCNMRGGAVILPPVNGGRIKIR
jgi:hypothetical protein